MKIFLRGLTLDISRLESTYIIEPRDRIAIKTQLKFKIRVNNFEGK